MYETLELLSHSTINIKMSRGKLQDGIVILRF